MQHQQVSQQKAIVVRLGNGTVTYYYKLASASENEYQEITNVNEETGAIQDTGITAGEKIYHKSSSEK